MVISETGGKKARKPQQIHRLDPLALAYVAEVASWGGAKYDLDEDGDHYNYLNGFPWSDTYDAGQRHQMLHWSGEDRDPESDLFHMGHAAWHALCQLGFMIRGIGTDDRPKKYQREPNEWDQLAEQAEALREQAIRTQTPVVIACRPNDEPKTELLDCDEERWHRARTGDSWYCTAATGCDEATATARAERNLVEANREVTTLADIRRKYSPLTFVG
nr:dATP/dGTP diphosphohydrolase domain-containing protein [Kribbella italica]